MAVAQAMTTINRSLLVKMAQQSGGMGLSGSPRLSGFALEGTCEVEDGASFCQLVEMSFSNASLQWTVLLCYRSLVSPAEFCALLQRFWDASDASRRMLICALLSTWIKRLGSFLDDCSRDVAGLLRHLADGGSEFGGAARRLLKDLESTQQPVAVPSELGEGVTSFEGLDPVVFANQVSMMSFALYRKIAPHELLQTRWMGANKYLSAPNVCAASNNANSLTLWMVTRVVEARDLRVRVAIMTNLIAAGMHFLQIRNYNAVVQVVSALGNAAVARLKHTFAGLSHRSRENLEALRALVESNNNFRSLRAAQDEAICSGVACLPFLGLWLTDLVMIEESLTPLVQPGGFVSLSKLRAVSKVLDMLILSQLHPYALPVVAAVSDWISKGSLLCPDPGLLFDLSLRAEAREQSSRDLTVLAAKVAE